MGNGRIHSQWAIRRKADGGKSREGREGKGGVMISAIIILIILGLMDLMLFVACFELEKEREIDEERRKNERGLD